jgi:hypothetical protein
LSSKMERMIRIPWSKSDERFISTTKLAQTRVISSKSCSTGRTSRRLETSGRAGYRNSN